jgi:hypothetical protein
MKSCINVTTLEDIKRVDVSSILVFNFALEQDVRKVQENEQWF